MYDSTYGMNRLSFRSQKASIGMLAEIKRRLDLFKRQETDIDRWSKSESFDRNWSRRSPFAAALCADSHCVCDIGCGMQSLRPLLPRHIKYLPADLAKRTEDTALCDLNRKKLPLEYLQQADTVTLLGVIEYVFDVPWLFEALRQSIGTLIVSYNPADMGGTGRRENGWVNDFRLDELVQMIHTAGYLVRDVNLVDPAQVMIRAAADSPKASSQSQPRATAI
jgi:hypothetical protein